MARKGHEATVYVLDVGPAMNECVQGEEETFFQQSVKCLQWIFQRKLFSESKDEFAVVLLGTQDTKNSLAQDDQFQNITEELELQPINWRFLNRLREINLSSVSGDFVDALLVALNMLHDDNSSSKQIVFFSNFGGEHSNDQIEAITMGLENEQVKLTVIGPELDDDEDEDSNYNGSSSSKSKTQIAGEELMKTVLQRCEGDSFTFADAIPQLMYFQKKKTRSVPWNINLELGPLQIPVSAFVKVSEFKPKTMKTCYAKDVNERLTTEVSYHKDDEAQTEVNKEETVKAYKYGTTLVPFSEEDKLNMQYKDCYKTLSVLGFTKQENVKTHYHMGTGNRLVVARKEDNAASVALSALIHALYETNMIAVVRYSYSARAQPKMAFLSPIIKTNYECLVLILLPFMEDMRRYMFAPLTVKPANNPTGDQLSAIDDLITAMDLCPTNEHDNKPEEILKPSSVVNPFMQRLYQCMAHRALTPEEPLPDVNKELHYLTQFYPSEELVKSSNPVVEKLKKLFVLKTVEKKRKNVGADVFQTNDKEEDKQDGPAAKKARLYDTLQGGLADVVQGSVTSIGTVTPVANFEQMLKDPEANPEEICKQMQKVIVQIVTESFGDRYYPKAMECLKALRSQAIKVATSQFNSFLKELKDSTSNNSRRSYWEMVCKENLSLIACTESSTSTVTIEESKEFLKDSKVDVTPLAEDGDEDDADDLLAQM